MGMEPGACALWACVQWLCWLLEIYHGLGIELPSTVFAELGQGPALQAYNMKYVEILCVVGSLSILNPLADKTSLLS